MKISKKAYYGLRAVLALAQTKEPLSIHSIAETEHLPEDYLEKILQTLRRGGIVEAKKGTSGGYALAKPITELSTWDILRVLDGPLEMFVPPVKGALPCLQVSHCQTNQVWRVLEEKIEQTLSDITLQSILESPRK
ncbi:MAG: Rrf2 family transcriptional regulator [Candidatus Moraniibacteriota bacterium]|nr:MAG: Rrf2 family transcriptional regulator [Candidatus Moranbacteria bacterium]